MTGGWRIGNAPCSWGALEFGGLTGEPIGAAQMLDELRETGYTGTELGDWGFMPTTPAALRAALAGRELAMIGAFVPVALRDPAAHRAGEAAALRVARLLAATTTDLPESERPCLVLADENGTVPARTKGAGRITPGQGLSAAGWATFARGAEGIARAVRAETGLRTVFHHHCAGYVETPDEIARFLDLTDPDLIGLVFDTGHYLYGAGDNDPQTVLAGLDRFALRIGHVHFKDCAPGVATQARAGGWDYFAAVRHGVFCELGRGAVPFLDVAERLRARGYGGWIVVEQDVLPGLGTPRESAARNRAYLAALGL
jgi:inosose dehydratase